MEWCIVIDFKSIQSHWIHLWNIVQPDDIIYIQNMFKDSGNQKKYKNTNIIKAY